MAPWQDIQCSTCLLCLTHTHTLHSNILLTLAMWTHKLFAHIYIIHTCYADTYILFARAHTSHAHYVDTLHAHTHTLAVHTHILCIHTLHTHGSAHTHYIPLAPTATALRLPGSLKLPRLEGGPLILTLPPQQQSPGPQLPPSSQEDPAVGRMGRGKQSLFLKITHFLPFPAGPYLCVPGQAS